MNNKGDLISREALKKALKRNCTPELCHDYNTAWCERVCPHNHFEDLIDEAPTIEEKSYAMGYQDGAEDGLQDIRPQGKWVYRNDNPLIPSGYYECDRCEIGKSLTEQNYCPYCGADMRGGDNHVAI